MFLNKMQRQQLINQYLLDLQRMLSPCSILSNNISIVSTLRKMLEKQVQQKHSSNLPSKQSAYNRLNALKRQSHEVKSQLHKLRDYVKRTTFSSLIPQQYQLIMRPDTKLKQSKLQYTFDDKENKMHNVDIKHYSSKSVNHTPTTFKDNHSLRSRIFKDLADLKKMEQKEKFIREKSQLRYKKPENTQYKRRPLEEILGINETKSVNHSHNSSIDQTFVTEESIETNIIQSAVTQIQSSNITVPSLRKSNTSSKSLICVCKQEYYSGDIVDGKPNGKGRLYICCDKATIKISQGAEFYSGGFKNGKMDGYGTLTFKNGTKFVGMFKEGLRHGDGSIYYKGSVEMGRWVNGKLTNKM